MQKELGVHIKHKHTNWSSSMWVISDPKSSQNSNKWWNWASNLSPKQQKPDLSDAIEKVPATFWMLPALVIQHTDEQQKDEN